LVQKPSKNISFVKLETEQAELSFHKKILHPNTLSAKPLEKSSSSLKYCHKKLFYKMKPLLSIIIINKFIFDMEKRTSLP